MHDEAALRSFGALIVRLQRRESLTREETRAAYSQIWRNSQPELQQGAFIAALQGKGETLDEIVGQRNRPAQGAAASVAAAPPPPAPESAPPTNPTIPTRRKGLRPNMSPSFPATGTSAVDVIRYAVVTHA